MTTFPHNAGAALVLVSVTGADVLEGITMSGPCMCGATDCPRCYPGCDRVVECEWCREEFRLLDLDNDGLCEECAAAHDRDQEEADRLDSEEQERIEQAIHEQKANENKEVAK